MKDTSSKSAGNLLGRGFWSWTKNQRKALSVGPASVMPSQTYFFPSNSVNPYKVDNIVMGNHEIASCTTTFWGA
jgi:hypothetical protein